MRPYVRTYTSLTNSYSSSPIPRPTVVPPGTPERVVVVSCGREQSYANNSRFLATVSNGQGLAQSLSWNLARNNSHGVPGGGANNADPFYCDAHQTTAPCQEVDDSGWSRVVLLSQSRTTVRLTQNGQGGTQTSTAITETTRCSYKLPYPLPAQECSDCVAGMYWGDQNNNNYLNYYNSTFMGFAQTTVNEPSGAVEVHTFYAGEGRGIYDPNEVTCFTTSPCHTDPWWDLANVAHGHEYQTLVYDTNGTTLLKETDTIFSATCPPTGVAGTPPKERDDHLGWPVDQRSGPQQPGGRV